MARAAFSTPRPDPAQVAALAAAWDSPLTPLTPASARAKVKREAATPTSALRARSQRKRNPSKKALEASATPPSASSTASRKRRKVKKEEIHSSDVEPLEDMRLVSDTEFEFEEDELPQPKRSNNKRKRGKTVAKKEEGQDVKPKKNSKAKRGVASPEKYAHLDELPDHVREELDILFCGINPGKMSAEIGHHFGNPTNHFWPCLFESGLTPTRLMPQQDGTVVDFGLGLTNLVSRPTAQEGELGQSEFPEGVPTLLAKAAYFRPRIVAFVGMQIANIVRSQVLPKHKQPPKPKKGEGSPIGLESYKLVYPSLLDSDRKGAVTETIFYTLPSTSGRVTQYQKSDKTKLFAHLKATLEDLNERKVDTSSYYIVDVASFATKPSGKGGAGKSSSTSTSPPPTAAGIIASTIADMDLNLEELMEIKEEILEGDA